jgi:hypothetical protein
MDFGTIFRTSTKIARMLSQLPVEAVATEIQQTWLGPAGTVKK